MGCKPSKHNNKVDIISKLDELESDLQVHTTNLRELNRQKSKLDKIRDKITRLREENDPKRVIVGKIGLAISIIRNYLSYINNCEDPEDLKHIIRGINKLKKLGFSEDEINRMDGDLKNGALTISTIRFVVETQLGNIKKKGASRRIMPL